MDLMLKGKVAMISGGSRGIGLCIARDLAAEGCHLVISARGKEGLKQAVEEINRQGGGRAMAFTGDVIQRGVPEAFLQETLAAHGGVDILVNNVGGAEPKRLPETTDDDWQKAFEQNLFQAVRLSRLVLPELKKRGGGSILNIASIAGRESGSAMTYNAAKAAMISFSKALAQETAKDNIRVNSLAPGSILFPGGVWERRIAAAPDGLRGFIASSLPFGRFGRPEEISAVAVFMVSPRASLVHGACWNVDGCQSRSNI
ncbi:MAG: SDR family oxidoreductase [Deltaproteobacteria bacterium]|nr:SDR family oxidoreductase [Deltaproteobacteria bacterium]